MIVVGGDEENLCIDIPPELGDLAQYNATLAHKVNHSFEPNSEFVLFSAHPVLGTVHTSPLLMISSENKFFERKNLKYLEPENYLICFLVLL